MAGRSKSKPLTRDDWLAGALELLEESGVEGIKVLPLSKRLGASRGSFYWHFRDRADLVASVLDYWDRWSTDSVIALLGQASGRDPTERIWLLMESVISDRLNARDLAVRAWALYDTEAERVVARVDRKRLATIRGLFQEAGFSSRECDARARLLATYLIGAGIVFMDDSPSRRKSLARDRWKLLVGR